MPSPFRSHTDTLAYAWESIEEPYTEAHGLSAFHDVQALAKERVSLLADLQRLEEALDRIGASTDDEWAREIAHAALAALHREKPQ